MTLPERRQRRLSRTLTKRHKWTVSVNLCDVCGKYFYIASENCAIKVSKVIALRHLAIFVLQTIIICLCIYLAPLLKLKDQKSIDEEEKEEEKEEKEEQEEEQEQKEEEEEKEEEDEKKEKVS